MLGSGLETGRGRRLRRAGLGKPSHWTNPAYSGASDHIGFIRLVKAFRDPLGTNLRIR